MRSLIKNNITAIIFLLLLLFLFRNWFFAQDIIGGDWPYLYPSMLSDFSGFTQLWSAQVGRGFGGVNINQSLYSYLHVSILLANATQVPWQVIYKIFWFGLFISASFFSSFYLLKKVIGKEVSQFGICCGAFFYTTNTYILMVAVGGQMGIALAYAILPFVINQLYTCLEHASNQKRAGYKPLLQEGITLGLAYALLIFFDVRIAYLTSYVLVLLTLFYYFFINRFLLRSFVIMCGFGMVIVILLHSYWLLPMLLYGGGAIPQEISSAKSFAFFSFTDFSHALSLLHPNWPENIFGKTSFLQPEFLLLPLLAFSGLLFIGNEKKKKKIYAIFLFFSFIAILCTFFAKGAKEPFGFINILVFEHVPGMSIFRDSTKFYFFIALSFSILITVSISMLYSKVSDKFKLNPHVLNILYAGFIIVWLLVIWPFTSGQLKGTFSQKRIPPQYIELEKLINGSDKFFRTLWVPEQSRYRVQSEQHPLLNASSFFNTTDRSKIVVKLASAHGVLDDSGVRYVIVPYDATGEVFVVDRKYSEKLRQYYIEQLNRIPWLTQIYNNKLTIYENNSYKSHAYLSKAGSVKIYRNDNATYYMAVSSDSSQNLYFMEEYSPHWKAFIDNKSELSIQKTDFNTMRVRVPKGLSKVTFVYEPQEVYAILQVFSGMSLIVFLSILFFVKNRDKKV